MNLPFSGGCACGAIRYASDREPIAMLNCHCSDCQMSSGAPFASGIIVTRDALQITGTPKTHTVKGSSGGETTRSFCPECGTPLFTTGAANPQMLSIRFPTLDDSAGFKPMLDIYAANAQEWVTLDPTIPHFAGTPT